MCQLLLVKQMPMSQRYAGSGISLILLWFSLRKLPCIVLPLSALPLMPIWDDESFGDGFSKYSLPARYTRLFSKKSSGVLRHAFVVCCWIVDCKPIVGDDLIVCHEQNYIRYLESIIFSRLPFGQKCSLKTKTEQQKRQKQKKNKMRDTTHQEPPPLPPGECNDTDCGLGLWLWISCQLK